MPAQSCTVTAVSTGHFHHPCQPSPSRKKRGRRRPAFRKRAVCLLSVRSCAWPLKWPPLRLARFPQPLFKGRSGCEVSGLCSWYCQVVLGAVTTALRNRSSVVDLRVVLDDIFRGRHDRSEFFGCLRGGGGRVTGGSCRPLSRPGPQGVREVLEKDSGHVGWCSQLGRPT